eukprot:14707228-Ditylum_brightwellii.AAC.1
MVVKKCFDSNTKQQHGVNQGILLDYFQFQRHCMSIWRSNNIPAVKVLIPPVSPEENPTTKGVAKGDNGGGDFWWRLNNAQ